MLDRSILDTVSHGTGVYLFYNELDKVLYVGKANDLRRRLTSYFSKRADDRHQIPYLMEEASTIKTILVTNELEALVLESNLIKLHQPKYNVLLRSDISHACLYLNMEHPWPKLTLIRSHQASSLKGRAYGPYLSSYMALEVMELLYELYPLRRCSDEELLRRERPCLWHEMKKCSAPCLTTSSKMTVKAPAISSIEYREMVDAIDAILRGDPKGVTAYLTTKIESASQRLKFEEANHWYQLKKKISKFFQDQSVECLSDEVGPLADLDVLTWNFSAEKFVQLCIRSGRVSEVRSYELRNVTKRTFANEVLKTLILQLYSEEVLPLDGLSGSRFELVVDLPLDIRTQLSSALKEKTGAAIQVSSSQRGFRRKWMLIAKRNLNHLVDVKAKNLDSNTSHSGSASSSKKAIVYELQAQLNLSQLPLWIECFDISHLGGEETVGSCIVYRNGERNREITRRYRLETRGGDDLLSLSELVQRRVNSLAKLKDRESAFPNLWIIDGGKTQLQQVQRKLLESDIVGVELLSISKEKANHSRGLLKEIIHIYRGRNSQHSIESIELDFDHPVLLFLQKIRDESHQLALNYQRHRRSHQIRRSNLDGVAGIGPVTKKRLLLHFESVAVIKRCRAEEIMQTSFLNQKQKRNIIDFFGLL